MNALIEQFVALREQRNDLSQVLRGVEGELHRLEEILIDHFDDEGLQSVKTEGGETLYLRSHLWVSSEHGTEDLCEALKRNSRTAWLVKDTVHLRQLSTWVKERLEEGDLPEDLKPHLRIAQTRKLGLRSA